MIFTCQSFNSRFKLAQEFNLVGSSLFSLVEFSIRVLADNFSLGKEITVSLDLSSGQVFDGFFLDFAVAHLSDVGSGLVDLVFKLGNGFSQGSLFSFVVLSVSTFLLVDSQISRFEVRLKFVDQFSQSDDVISVEGLSKVGLDEGIVDWENLVTVARSDGNSEETVDELDEVGWDDTFSFQFEFVQVVNKSVDFDHCFLESLLSQLVKVDLSISDSFEVSELFVVDFEGSLGKVSNVGGSLLFRGADGSLGVGSIEGVFSSADFGVSEDLFVGTLLSLLGVESKMLLVFLLDLDLEGFEVGDEGVGGSVIKVFLLEEGKDIAERNDFWVADLLADQGSIDFKWMDLLEGV